MGALCVAVGFVLGFAVWRLMLYVLFRHVFRDLHWQHEPFGFFLVCLAPAWIWAVAFAIGAAFERAHSGLLSLALFGVAFAPVLTISGQVVLLGFLGYGRRVDGG